MTAIPGPDLPPGTVVEHRPADGVEWEFRDRRIEGVTFRGITDGAEWMTFRQVVFVDCTFEECDLQWQWGSHHRHQDRAAHLVGCSIVRCDLRSFSLPYGRIEGCTIEDSRWASPLDAVDLVDNTFVGVVDSLTIQGRHTPFPGITPRPGRNDIRGNDFRSADLRGFGLRGGVPVHDQRWPEGPGCAVVDRIPERVAVILERTAGAQDPLARELHESARWWGFDNDDEESVQREAWLRWDDPLMPDSSNRFHRALAETRLA